MKKSKIKNNHIITKTFSLLIFLILASFTFINFTQNTNTSSKVNFPAQTIFAQTFPSLSVCGGSQYCVPSVSPSVVPSTTPGTQQSMIILSPATAQTPCLPVNYQSRDSRSRPHHHHHKNGGGGGNGALSSFIQQLIDLLNKLLALLGLQPIQNPGNPSQPLPSTLPLPSGTNPIPVTPGSVNPCPSNAPVAVPPVTSAQPPASVSSPATLPSIGVPSGTPNQTLGVCGIPAPTAGSNVVLSPSDSTADLNITSGGTAGNPKIYDGGCHTVGTINIKADYVVVENFKIVATGQYGIHSDGTGVTIQNNDIKNVHTSGDGDLNAITFFGNDTKILYNTAIDFVTGSPGSSHTDAIQTWVSSSDPTGSTNVTIQGNKFTGPANPSRDPNIASIHQCVMAEGLNAGGNIGGSGNSSNWLIADNYFSDSLNQCIKLDNIDNVSVTRNDFAGSSDKIMEVTAASTGVVYYSDNKVTGSYINGVGTTVTQSAGPASL